MDGTLTQKATLRKASQALHTLTAPTGGSTPGQDARLPRQFPWGHLPEHQAHTQINAVTLRRRLPRPPYRQHGGSGALAGGCTEPYSSSRNYYAQLPSCPWHGGPSAASAVFCALCCNRRCRLAVTSEVWGSVLPSERPRAYPFQCTQLNLDGCEAVIELTTALTASLMHEYMQTYGNRCNPSRKAS